MSLQQAKREYYEVREGADHYFSDIRDADNYIKELEKINVQMVTMFEIINKGCDCHWKVSIKKLIETATGNKIDEVMEAGE